MVREVKKNFLTIVVTPCHFEKIEKHVNRDPVLLSHGFHKILCLRKFSL